MILILGSDGLLGSSLANRLDRTKLICTSRKPSSSQIYFDMNMSISDLISSLPPIKCAIVCTALSNVGYCQANIRECFDVNYHSTVRLVEQLSLLAIPSIVFSSEYVYDGLSDLQYKESSLICPTTIYGSSKAILEVALSNFHEYCTIFRISKLASLRHHRSFLFKMFNDIKSSDIYCAATDQFFSPIYLEDAIKVITHSIRDELPRQLYNLCGRECLSRYHLALSFVSKFDLECQIQPISIKSLDLPYKIPPNLSMSPSLLESCLPLKFSFSDEYLNDYS